MKFKKGDKVKIICNLSKRITNNGFNNKKTFKIKKVSSEYADRFPYLINGFWFLEEDLKKVTSKTKLLKKRIARQKNIIDAINKENEKLKEELQEANALIKENADAENQEILRLDAVIDDLENELENAYRKNVELLKNSNSIDHIYIINKNCD